MISRLVPVVLSVSSLFGGDLTPAEKAIAAARQTIAKAEDKADGYNSLAIALARRARETADSKFYEQAEAAAAKSLELAADNYEGLRARCWILLGKHEFAQARDLAKKLNARMADDAMVYGFLVDANIELGNYKEAEEAAQWMLDLSRSSIPAVTRAAYLREIFGDIEGALELMRAAYQRINPAETEDRAWTLVQIAHLLSSTGKADDAGLILEEALQLVPDYHYALGAFGKLQSAKGNHQEGVKLLRRRYELAPHPENLFDLGIALHHGGRQAESKVVFQQFEKLALAESGGWDNANRELAAWYADYANKPDDALNIAKREIARRADIATLDVYAWALYRAGKYRDAAVQINKAMSVGTQDPKILFHAGAIALAAGDKVKGASYLHRSLEVNAKSEVAADARRLLSE
jgi:tetratricopeptide (TPR) repeat protein